MVRHKSDPNKLQGIVDIGRPNTTSESLNKVSAETILISYLKEYSKASFQSIFLPLGTLAASVRGVNM